MFGSGINVVSHQVASKGTIRPNDPWHDLEAYAKVQAMSPGKRDSKWAADMSVFPSALGESAKRFGRMVGE